MRGKMQSGKDAKKELRRQWVLWYRGSICAELRKKPRSQSELFKCLARRDGRPNPETRGHPDLMPTSATIALEGLIKEKIVECEKSKSFITLRLAGKPVLLVKKPRLELRRSPAPHAATAAHKVIRPKKGKDRRSNAFGKSIQKLAGKLVSLGAQVNLLSRRMRALERNRGRSSYAVGKSVNKLPEKLVALDAQARQLSQQVKEFGKERARRDIVAGKVVQEFDSRIASLEGRVGDSQKSGKDSDGVSSRLDDLDRRLGVFEEQVGRVARSVKAVVAEPRPAASDADGGG